MLTIQQRSLVLDYLCHSGYVNSARALARGSSPRLDADGDEIMSATLDSAPLPEDALQEARKREGAFYTSSRTLSAKLIFGL